MKILTALVLAVVVGNLPAILIEQAAPHASAWCKSSDPRHGTGHLKPRP